MRDRQHFAAGLLLVIRQILPQIARVGAALRRRHRVGHHLPRPDRAVTHDDDTMHVVAFDQRGPLETDEGCKTPRVVERLGIVDDLFPEILVELRARRIEREHLRVHPALREGCDQIDRCQNRRVAAFRDPLVPARCLFVRQQFRFASNDIAGHAHAVGVIGDHQPIQRARQPHCLPGGGQHFLATREPVGNARRQAVTEQPRIKRESGMEMGVAPERTLRKIATRIGRIDLAGIGIGQQIRCRSARILRRGRERDHQRRNESHGDNKSRHWSNPFHRYFPSNLEFHGDRAQFSPCHSRFDLPIGCASQANAEYTYISFRSFFSNRASSAISVSVQYFHATPRLP